VGGDGCILPLLDVGGGAHVGFILTSKITGS
jgi:hypothetical protein